MACRFPNHRIIGTFMFGSQTLDGLLWRPCHVAPTAKWAFMVGGIATMVDGLPTWIPTILRCHGVMCVMAAKQAQCWQRKRLCWSSKIMECRSSKMMITIFFPSYTFIGWDKASLSYLPYGYGDIFPAFLTHRSGVDKHIVDLMRSSFDKGVGYCIYDVVILCIFSNGIFVINFLFYFRCVPTLCQISCSNSTAKNTRMIICDESMMCKLVVGMDMH